MATLQELAAEVRESGEDIPWGPFDGRVESFFQCVVYPSPEHGVFREKHGKWMKVMHFKLEMLVGSRPEFQDFENLGKVCSITRTHQNFASPQQCQARGLSAGWHCSECT